MPAVLALSAPSADVVWVLANGRFLFLSTDRGATWSPRSLPGPRAGDISFISDRVGWAADFDAARVLTIWRTDDGAATWRVARRIGDFQVNGTPGLVTLVDERRGFLETQTGGAPPSIFRTADGGATWARSAPLPVTSPAGRVVVAGGELLVPAAATVLRSLDGGATWAVAGSTPDGRPVGGVASATHWTEGPLGLATDDAGRTWHEWAASYRQAAGVAPGIEFGGGTTVYAFVRGSIQRSDDDGATWVAVHTPGT